MLASANKLINNPYQDILSAIISAHVYKTMEGNFSEFASRIQIHRRTAWEWAQGTQIPQLDALLRICSYFGTTPVQLFIGDFQEVALAPQNSSKKKSTSERPRRLFKRFEAEKLQDVLEQVLQSEEYPPPSMREVAQRLHYDQSHLRKHFRCLCQAISARYKAYQQAQRQERLRKMNAQVQQTAEGLNAQSRTLSERQIGKMLGKRGIFKEDAARAALKNFLIH
jgi:transcriptional regulator with XRE-family HTH domain